jgi:hypothetical protein
MEEKTNHDTKNRKIIRNDFTDLVNTYEQDKENFLKIDPEELMPDQTTIEQGAKSLETLKSILNTEFTKDQIPKISTELFPQVLLGWKNIRRQFMQRPKFSKDQSQLTEKFLSNLQTMYLGEQIILPNPKMQLLNEVIQDFDKEKTKLIGALMNHNEKYAIFNQIKSAKELSIDNNSTIAKLDQDTVEGFQLFISSLETLKDSQKEGKLPDKKVLLTCWQGFSKANTETERPIPRQKMIYKELMKSLDSPKQDKQI